MTNIEKIKVGSTSYDVRDANAAHVLTDIATAGTNITFETPMTTNYSTVGSAVTVDGSGIASGFTGNSYLRMNQWNTIANAGSFTFLTKIKLTTGNSGVLVRLSDGVTVFQIYIDNLKINYQGRTSADGAWNISSNSVLSPNADYWIKVIFTSGSSSVVQYSSDGTTFTEVLNKPLTGTNFVNSSNWFIIGSYGNSDPFPGTIDLVETSFKDSNGNILWAPVTVSGIPSINASVPSVDQTYDGTSANAQSGAAINGAKFLRNLSTGSNSVDVDYAGTANNSVTLGANTTSAPSAVTIGSGAKGNAYGISIGRAAGTSGAVGNNAISIGNNANPASAPPAGANSISIGNFSMCTGNNAVAIGTGPTSNNCKATADGAIQLGYGTNSTTKTLSVGFYDADTPVNYELLSADGTIPAARLVHAPGGGSTSLSDIAVAGDNITFTELPYKDITITGSVTLNDGIASNFTASNYIDFNDSTRYTTGTTTYYLKFKTPSSGTIRGDVLNWNRWANLEFWSGSGLNAWNWGSNSAVNLLTDSQVQSDTDYFFKIDIDYENKTKTYSYSLDGTAYTQLASFTDTGMTTSYSNPLRLGNSSYSPDSGGAFTGSIDLGSCYIERGGAEIARGYYSNAKTEISASGLPNTATKASSVTLLGDPAASSNSVNIGYNSSATSYNYANATSVGYSAKASNNTSTAFGAYAVASGQESTAIGGGSNSSGITQNNATATARYAIALGNNTRATQQSAIAIGGGQNTTLASGSYAIAIGGSYSSYTTYSSGSNSIAIGSASSSTKTYSIALGPFANATGDYAIQLGYGTNSTANTMNVGLSSSLNVQLLDSSGNIPAARLGTLPVADGTYIPVLTITGGVPTITWTAYTP